MTVKQLPHYKVSADVLADWILSQTGSWWVVDGDPLLTSFVDFPCPGDELAPEIRKVGKFLLVLDKDPDSHATGEVVSSKQLESLSDQSDRHRQKTLRLAWDGSKVDWLLIQDNEPTDAR